MVRATFSRFKTTRNRVADFIKYQYQKSDLFLDELNHQFVVVFEYYLKTQIHIDHNTTMKYVRNMKKIVAMAVSHGWLHVNPFQNFKCTYRKVNRNILTSEELQQLSDKYLSIKRMEEVKDVFLFCCYTGLSFVDVQKLSQAHIVMGIDREKWLQINRTKTNVRSNIPLLPQALSIIEKYKNHPECKLKDRLLPVKSNQKMNAYLKELADLCSIQKKLTMHIARHTFATTVTLANGVPIETVSSMLGHSNLRTTQIYAKVIEQKISEDMQLLRKKFDYNREEQMLKLVEVQIKQA